MNADQFSGAAAQTATQFVIAQEKIGLLLGTGGKTFKRIGSLFKVHIHLTSGHHQSGEWVSIYGKEEDRARAKEYIMSMCNPMVEEKIPYSADLHEHLVGKGGKTHRYLESNSSAVITFSTSCTGPNEHTAHVRGSKESVAQATALIKEIIRKTTKRRQKENQPPGSSTLVPSSIKPEDLDKELLHALKAENNLAFWENIKNQPEDAKRAYLVQLHRRKMQGGAETSPSSSSEGALEDGISSNADLLAYTKKLQLSEDDAKKVLHDAAQAGSGFSKNDFIANMLQMQRGTEVRKSDQNVVSSSLGGMYRSTYGHPEFHSYPGLVSDCAQDFRLEQPGSSNSFEKIPLGLTARSIVPHPALQHPTHLDQLSSEFSSAPAAPTHFAGSRYDPANALTLDQFLIGKSSAPNLQTALHPAPLREESLDPLIKLLIEQKEEDLRQRTERQRNERVQELLLRHTQQQREQQRYQQLAAQQKLLQFQRDQHTAQQNAQAQHTLQQQVSQLSNEELFSLYKQRQQYVQGSGAPLAPASSQLSGSSGTSALNSAGQGLNSAPLTLTSTTFGSASGFGSGVIGNSAPNLSTGSTPQIGSSVVPHKSGVLNGSAGPLSPANTPYDLMATGAGNLLPTPASFSGAGNLYRATADRELLRDVENSDQVADLIKHLNL